MSSIWDLLDDPPSITWDDERLISACRNGDHAAWQALIQKYQRLIYSVPRKYGLDPDDAAEVFQVVCVELYQQLDQIRQAGAIRGWLVRVAARNCLRVRRLAHQGRSEELPEDLPGDEVPDTELLELEQRQVVREGIASISERCRKLVHELFFVDPPRPYAEVARELGLAVGSIGFIRGRCLESLRKALVRA